jgi:hypothetical protein
MYDHLKNAWAVRLRAFTPKHALLAIALILSPSCAAIDYRVELSDTTLAQGSVAYFRLSGARGIERTPAVFTGGIVRITKSPDNTALGIIATDLETRPGFHELTIGTGRHMKKTTVEVTEGGYGTQRLRLPTNMVDFDPETLQRINREAAEISLVWLASNTEPLWTGPFVMPAKGPVTSRSTSR